MLRSYALTSMNSQTTEDCLVSVPSTLCAFSRPYGVAVEVSFPSTLTRFFVLTGVDATGFSDQAMNHGSPRVTARVRWRIASGAPGCAIDEF